MAKNSRNYPKKPEEELKDTIKKLRNQLRKLQKKFNNLLEDYKSMEQAWKKTESFLKASVEDIPVEELLKHNKIPRKIVKKQPTSQEDDARKRAIQNAINFLEEKKKRNKE